MTAAPELDPARPHGQRYRDELNFCEFPLATLADTPADRQKTLEFTDEIFDPSTGKPVARTLVITAADKFGLPTALDDEVLLGLMQLSCEQGFADRKVHFSRYELIKLLGWRDESKSYRRVEDSLNRWAGVTLQYKRAWWSKEEQCWVNETFHVIDQVTVFDRERIGRRRKMAAGTPDKALSSFVWNDTVFQSFKAGYIKALDFDFYKSLGSSISKRLFRFLDKRFYHRGRWEFDLRALSCEHVGLSKNYSNSELKRKLLVAVTELEERGFLAPLADAERFVRVRQGEWRVVFVRAGRKVAALNADGAGGALVEQLVGRGITRRSAEKLVAQHPRERVEEKVRLFDALRKRGGDSGIKNRAGWLYAAIARDFALPGGETQPEPPAPSTAPVVEAPIGSTPTAEERAFEAHWAALSPDGQEVFERDAVASAPPFLRRQYEDGFAAKGSLWQASRERLLLAHFAKR